MTIKASKKQFEQEEKGNSELVLVAVTYTGSHGHYLDNAVRQQGNWPSYGGFTQDVANVAFVPDSGLGFFEKHQDFDVEYGEQEIAQALLEKNYLAPEVFSSGAGGGNVRSRVLDFLGIESLPTTEQGIREMLADIAEVDDAGEEAQSSLSDELMDENRSDLKAVTKELREDTEEISLNGGKTEFAEYLADFVEDGDMTETELWDEIREVRE